MPWIITKDLIADHKARQPSNANAVGMVGPSTAKMTADEILNHSQGRRFRMKDDDGVVYYEGIIVFTPEDGDGAEFHPLDDFGKPNAGATSIEYQWADGTWDAV